MTQDFRRGGRSQPVEGRAVDGQEGAGEEDVDVGDADRERDVAAVGKIEGFAGRSYDKRITKREYFHIELEP